MLDVTTAVPRRAVVLVLAAAAFAALLQGGHCYVQLGSYTSLENSPPVTNWLLTQSEGSSTITGVQGIPSSQRAAWKRIGAKIWWFLSNMDHDFMMSGKTAPPSLPGAQRAYGTSVSCGSFARKFIRMMFHDCGTYDVGNTGSEGDTGRPRFGCNASLRKEVGPCPGGSGCWNGAERAFNLSTGAWLNKTAFADVEARWGTAKIDWSQDAAHPRFENRGFAVSLAFYYQIKQEAAAETSSTYRLTVSLADIIIYAGFLATAKCGGPQVEFQPGRRDVSTQDAPGHLPDPTEPLHANVAYFWNNGVTNFDMVNLLAAHSTACFSIGCLDNTPSRFDSDWAAQLLLLSNGSDSRICQFDAAGNPPFIARQLCFLPADAEFAARADTRAYLTALTQTNSLSISNAACNPVAPYSPVGSCLPTLANPTCTNRYAPWVPFKVLSERNMCNKLSVTKVGCGTTNSAQRNLNDAVATSFFKMSKWYAVNNINQGFAFGVDRQPCQPGLIKIASAEEEPNPKCTCCETAWPQTFSYVAPPVQTAALINTAAAEAEAAATLTQPEVPVVAAAVDDAAIAASATAAAAAATVAQADTAVITEAGLAASTDIPAPAAAVEADAATAAAAAAVELTATAPGVVVGVEDPATVAATAAATPPPVPFNARKWAALMQDNFWA